MNILILEDDLLFAKALTVKLVEQGHKVILAENEQKALELVNSNKVEFIICDMLNIITGVNLQTLIKMYLDKQKPIIITTTIPDAIKILHSMEIKGAIIFEKPIIINDLIKSVQQLKTI